MVKNFKKVNRHLGSRLLRFQCFNNNLVRQDRTAVFWLEQARTQLADDTEESMLSFLYDLLNIITYILQQHLSHLNVTFQCYPVCISTASSIIQTVFFPLLGKKTYLGHVSSTQRTCEAYIFLCGQFTSHVAQPYPPLRRGRGVSVG